MKNYLLMPGILLFVSLSTVAQNSETIRVRAGNDIAAAVSDYGIYRLPAFEKGTVFFKDGKLGKELLNYNILIGQVMYIDKKGDTLAIADPEEIKKIDINGIVFYNDKQGWSEKIADASPANLVMKRKITISYQKEGAFGISNSTNGIDSYTNYTSDNASYHLYVSDDVTIKKLTSYFLLTKDGQLLPANKGNFYNQFAGNKKDIENYLSSNKVNFSKEQDLVHLLAVTGAINQ
jgi:hypothetical protein